MSVSQQSSTTEQARWFAEEIQPIEPQLRAYLSRSLPLQADVDDVIQDSYVRLLKAKEKGTIRRIKPFLFAITRNVARDLLHRQNKTEALPITENSALPVLVDDDDLLETVCRRQELMLLTEALDALPERCREVVLLRKIKGLSQREIAELLGIAEHTVESLSAKGVRRCAEYLRARGAARFPSDVAKR